MKFFRLQMFMVLSTFSFLFPSLDRAFGDELPAGYPIILDEQAMMDGQNGKSFVNPCEDFYQFSCGQWLANTEIPAEKRNVSRQATMPLEMTDVILNRILEKYAQGDFSTPSSQAKQLGAYYKSCMTVDSTNSQSLNYLKNQIRIVNDVKSRAELPRLVALQQSFGFAPFFSFSSFQDPEDSNQVISNLAQGGISLPDIDYYLNPSDESKKLLADYQVYITNLLQAFGYNKIAAKKAAGVVVKLETDLASVSLSLEDRYDSEKTVHISNFSAVGSEYSHFDWSTYFKTLGLDSAALSRLNIEEPEFFKKYSELMKSEKLENLKTYMIFKIANNGASLMSGKLNELYFNFWRKRLNGITKQQPRWKFCTQGVENQLGYALAEAYVGTFNGADIKAKTEKMISDVKDVFETDLISLSQGPDAWLDQDTYVGALEKIRLMGQKVGAPEQWRNYSQLEKQGSNYLFNSLYVSRFEFNRDLKKIGKPVDRQEWYMMPWEFNAYYDPANNEFNFPFGILQPPSLDFNFTDGANLGSFGGGTIGHELTHGFDNSGAQYDAHGNVRNWWSEETAKNFESRSQCFIAQANNYLIKDVNLTVDGQQTLTENLADQGGVKLGYLALEKLLANRPEGKTWNGFTERQQYWIAYAQSWCTKSRPEALKVQMASDPHPPAEFRVNGIMMNRPEFAKDFKCTSGQAMAPVNRCSIW